MSTAPRRIVSLVPSLTEALFALGLGPRVVGVTDWCVHPREGVAGLPRVGGTKTPSLEAIRALRPDLVIANREENRRRDVERLREAGLRVLVTYPRTVRDGAELLFELASLGAPADRVRDVAATNLEAVQRAEAREWTERPRVLCAIWKGPWMTVGGDTYAHDLLRLCGGENPFADDGDRRYPRLREARIREAAPEVVLLPDEPYAFGPADAAEVAAMEIPAALDGRIHLIDGTLISWYGPRIHEAIRVVTDLLHPEGAE